MAINGLNIFPKYCLKYSLKKSYLNILRIFLRLISPPATASASATSRDNVGGKVPWGELPVGESNRGEMSGRELSMGDVPGGEAPGGTARG